MPNLVYDFADAALAEKFPAHGWVRNSQDVKLLRCPLRLHLAQLTLQNPHAGRPAVNRSYVNAFSATLAHLGSALTELHKLIRVAADHSVSEESKPEELDADYAAIRVAPLFADLAVVYLRRLPDLLTRACRPLLFKKWGSVPLGFRDWVKDPDRLAEKEPTCDFQVLLHVLTRADWFTALRERASDSRKKGLRDVLEHRPVVLLVGKHQIGEDRPVITIRLDSDESDVETQTDILPAIRAAVSGLCALMTAVQESIVSEGTYERRDVLFLLGRDEDTVGFWPAIGS